MSSPRSVEAARQITLGESQATRTYFVPEVRPHADPELEETFVRAAAAWARWRDRSLWEGR